MKNKAILQVNLAVLLFGCAGLFAKWIGISSMGITFFRVVFSSITLMSFCFLAKRDVRLKEKMDLLWFFICGAILALHWITFLGAMQISTVAIGSISFSTYPLMLAFLEPMVFHEKPEKEDFLAAVLVVLGVLITIPKFSVENNMFQGVLVGLLSAITYAVLSMANRRFTKRYEGEVISLYEQGIAALVMIPVILKFPVHPTAHDMVLLVILGVFSTAIAHTLFISSLSKISAQTAGIVASSESVYGIVLAFLVLHEVPSVREIVGAVLIIGVVIVTQIRKAKEHD
ncbi:MAG: DMT family transporter [Lachnospiraceae bacterium]|nr:DMT family transporter [Lachnospiraceae bacterium]